MNSTKMAGSFSKILNQLVVIQVCSSTVFLLCPSKWLMFYNEIMWFFFSKEKTIRQKYEKCFQLSKANIDLNRSRFSWLTAADN